jgi:hypothetical protein
MLVVAGAVTTYPRRAALARAPFCRPSLIRRPEVPCTKTGQIDRAQQASPESATLRSLSERLTLVTAVTGILLRHGCKIPKIPLHDLLLLLVFESECGIYLFSLLLIYLFNRPAVILATSQ